ncbi:MAG: ABC transporter permease [Candidatus Heimdallarchaeaceae archaeon]|jgi:ABC-type antimicrobial peptide transport system permease subunit
MKKIGIFSHIGYAIDSILSYKRRNLSIGAGIILGAAIFSSIFFYGALVNTIAVQDIVNDIEAEVIFYPNSDANITTTPLEFAESVELNEEFTDTSIIYGPDMAGDYSYLTSLILLEDNSSQITYFPWGENFEAVIFDSSDQEGEIIQQIKLITGVLDLSNGGCLLSDKISRAYGISINETLQFNMSIGQIFIHPNGYTFTSIYYSIINLTITGLYQSNLFNSDNVIFSSEGLESELTDRLTEYRLYSIYAKLDYAKLPVNDLQELNKRIDRLVQTVEIQNEGELLGTNIVSTFLGENQIRIIMMQLIDTILYIPAIFLSLILATSGTELSLQERKKEVASLKAQGASPKQIKLMIYTEVIIIGLIASFIGIIFGILIATIVLSVSRFMTIDFSTFGEAFRTIRITPFSVLGTIFIAMGISLITTSIKTKTFIAQEVVEGTEIEKKKPNLLKRIYGDYIIFLIGLLGVILNLVQDLNPEVAFGFSTVLLQFISPIFLWFGAAFIASRVATKIPELLDRFIIRIFKDIGMLIKGSLGRRNQHFPRITVLLCLSISLSVLAAIQGYTGDKTLDRQAEYITGGDLKLEIYTSSLTLSEANFTGFEDQIESVVPIYYANLKFSISATYYRTAHCYGTNISLYKEKAIWHKDSLVNFADYREGLSLLESDPTGTIAVSREIQEIIDVTQNSTIHFASRNDYLPTVFADANVVFDHVPAIENPDVFSSDVIVLSETEFLTSNFLNDTKLIRAIVNLKPEYKNNLRQLQTDLLVSFDWINEVYTYEDVLREVEDEQGRFYGIPGLLSIDYIISLSAILIGISIFMFMIINKRRKEFAILIAEGTSKKQLVKLVLSEILSIALFSTLFGFIIGFLSAYQFNSFFDVFDLATFNRMLHIPVISLVLTVILSFIVIILATLIPAISASRIKVVEEMRTY